MIICPDWASYFSLVETILPLSPPWRDILAYITIAVIFLELEQHSLSIKRQVWARDTKTPRLFYNSFNIIFNKRHNHFFVPLCPPSPSRDRDGIGRRDILAYITIAVIFLELKQHSLSIKRQACPPSGRRGSQFSGSIWSHELLSMPRLLNRIMKNPYVTFKGSTNNH